MTTTESPTRRATPDLASTLRGAAEARRLVRGGHWYVGDHIGPHHAWVHVVRSEIAHGRIESIDTAEALDMPGVHAVLTAEDLGDQIPVIPTRLTAVDDAYLQPVLASEVVRYVGDPVALVVADTPYQAEDAAETVFADIEPLEAVTDVDADRDGLDDRGGGVLAQGAWRLGDVDAAFEEADLVISESFRLPRMTGLPIETRGLAAEWREEDGQRNLHLWGPTKYVYPTRNNVANMLGIQPDEVIVHSVDVGGMFGVRGEFYPEDFLIPWAATLLDRPVAWIEDRREHMLTINHSREQVNDMELAVDADGTLLAFRSHVRIDAGAYARPIGSRQVTLMAEALPGPYRWRAMDIQVRSTLTNKTPVGNMRGPLAFEATFARERMVDLAAERLGMDRLEIRRHNLIPHDLIPYETRLEGEHEELLVYDSGDFHEALDSAVDHFDLDEVRTSVARRRENGEWVGWGVATFAEHSGPGREETVRVTLAHDGILTVNTGACDIGQGLSGFAVAVASEQLGIGAEHVRTITGDTRTDVDARGTNGSRSSIFVGSAIADAIDRVRQHAVTQAAERLGADAETVHIGPDGPVVEGELLPWKELAPFEALGRHVMPKPAWGIGANLAVVSVDPGTLEVRAERLLVAYDCGRAVDPGAVEGQLVGGAIAGLGGALFEEILYDDNGQPLTTTLMEYVLPSYAEVPQIDVVVLELEPSPTNPLGIKGAGEAGVLGVGAVLASAVTDALASQQAGAVTRLPLRPDRICELVEGADR